MTCRDNSISILIFVPFLFVFHTLNGQYGTTNQHISLNNHPQISSRNNTLAAPEGYVATLVASSGQKRQEPALRALPAQH